MNAACIAGRAVPSSRTSNRKDPTVSCSHPRADAELPCPWPQCDEGTPQQTLVILRGSEASVTAVRDRRLTIEADGGAEMYRRRQTPAGWEWVRS